nr:MAG TPA: hypothetical protein [Caudoviricetes sp.]
MKIHYKKHKIYLNKQDKDFIIRNFDTIINQKPGHFVLESNKKYLIRYSHELKYIRVLTTFASDFYIDCVDNETNIIDILKMSDKRNIAFSKIIYKTKYDKIIKDSLNTIDPLNYNIIKI